MSELLLSILRAAAVHTGYTLVCVAAGFVLGLALGIGLSRLPTLANYLIPLLSILNTVPGIVFIGVLVILIGMTPGDYRPVHLCYVPGAEKHRHRPERGGPAV